MDQVASLALVLPKYLRQYRGDRLTVCSDLKRVARKGRFMSGRSVNIGRDAVGNIIQTGDHNTAELRYKKVQLPRPENVDIRKEIDALKQLLGQLKTDDQQKIVNAVSEAAGDAAKPNPDKDEVGKALERALGYASKAADFGEKTGQIATHLQNAVGWLGDNWHKLLPLVGLAL
jgi:hypothetical protein